MSRSIRRTRGGSASRRTALLRVRSRRGSLVARSFITPTIQPGQVFIPMHYVETNRLTIAAFDPSSRQPAYKACAVRLEKVGKPSKRKVSAPATVAAGILPAVEPGILPGGSA